MHFYESDRIDNEVICVCERYVPIVVQKANGVLNAT